MNQTSKQRSVLSWPGWMVMVVLLFVASSGSVLSQEVGGVKGRQLLDSIKDRKFDVFKALLKSGADPNVTLGPVFYDTPMCLAATKGFERYLRLLVQYGGDTNLLNTTGSQSWATPLACSIKFGNRNSFNYLLAEGADPDGVLCPACETGYQGSPLKRALVGRKFDMAMQLIEITEVDEWEMNTIIFILEKARTRADHVTNDARTELIEWVRAQGHEVNPTTPGRY